MSVIRAVTAAYRRRPGAFAEELLANAGRNRLDLPHERAAA